MPEAAVIRAASLVLAHTPGLARHGSKPMRTLPVDAELTSSFLTKLRSFDDVRWMASMQPERQLVAIDAHPNRA